MVSRPAEIHSPRTDTLRGKLGDISEEDSTRVDFELQPAVKNQRYNPSEIKRRLQNDEIHIALLLAATKCELIFADTIRMELGLSESQFDAMGFDY